MSQSDTETAEQEALILQSAGLLVDKAHAVLAPIEGSMQRAGTSREIQGLVWRIIAAAANQKAEACNDRPGN